MAKQREKYIPVTPFESGGINRVRQIKERGHYDRDAVFGVLDAGLVAHVAVIDERRPVAIPMIYGRDGDRIFLHGHRKSRVISRDQAESISMAVTIVDGIIVARSAFESSMNYRSAVIHGKAFTLQDDEERLHALRCITEHTLPGRWDEVREPYPQELKATGIIEVEIEAASAKLRQAPVYDDYKPDPQVWAGIVPVITAFGAPIPDKTVNASVPVPASLRWRRR